MNVMVCMEIYLSKAVIKNVMTAVTYNDYKIISYMDLIICDNFNHYSLLNNYVVFNFKYNK